jgi:hypothetical protein
VFRGRRVGDMATCPKTLRPSRFALAASRRRWLSITRSRRLPICSRRVRFSSMRYSITSAASDSASRQGKQRETKMDPDRLASRELIMRQQFTPSDTINAVSGTLRDRRTRAGRISKVHRPAITRSATRKFGDRFRPDSESGLGVASKRIRQQQTGVHQADQAE